MSSPCTYTDNNLNIYTKELGNDIINYGSDIAYSNYIKKLKNLYDTMNKPIQEFTDCIKNNTKAPESTGKIVMWVFIALLIIFLVIVLILIIKKKMQNNEKKTEYFVEVEVGGRGVSQTVKIPDYKPPQSSQPVELIDRTKIYGNNNKQKNISTERNNNPVLYNEQKKSESNDSLYFITNPNEYYNLNN